MGDEYTPTTEEIRDYVGEGGEPRPWIAPNEDAEKEAARLAAFDRWLAEHDAQVIESARNRLTGHEAPGPQLQAMADERRGADEHRRRLAYQSGEWCGECAFGVVEDPPCCTHPEPHDSGREDER